MTLLAELSLVLTGLNNTLLRWLHSIFLRTSFDARLRYRGFIPGDSGGTLVVRYFLPVIASDQTGEAEFALFRRIAEQAIGNSIFRVIRNNQPTGPQIENVW